MLFRSQAIDYATLHRSGYLKCLIAEEYPAYSASEGLARMAKVTSTGTVVSSLVDPRVSHQDLMPVVHKLLGNWVLVRTWDDAVRLSTSLKRSGGPSIGIITR